ncbi:MAG: signal peptidase I [Ornithinibacter sp.]
MPSPTEISEHPARTGRTPVRAVAPVLVVLVALVVLLVTAVEPLRVTSQSMSPTLDTGDQVLVDKLSGRWRAPAVGDIVVYRDPVGERLVVKRVVAVGGQSVALEDGELVVDSTVRHEPQVDVSRIDSTYFGPVTVPPDAVFVLGDNRAESIDSRTYGPIPVEDLLGRVVLTF